MNLIRSLLNVKNRNLIYSLLTILLFFTSCGRKQKNIFYFPETKTVEKINKLDLPATKILSVKKINNYNEIIWQKVKSNNDFLKEKNIKFIGYNIYKLVNSSIVPKKSLNTKIIIQEKFLDKNLNIKSKEDSYIVRTIFKKNNKFLLGPTSQVFRISCD